MSSFASDPRRARTASLALLALAACARPAPRERAITWEPTCLDGSGAPSHALSIEVWESPEPGTTCADCRAGRAGCTLLERRCHPLAAPTVVPELDEALGGVTARASDGAVCVHVVGTLDDACAGAGCTGPDCETALAYCADSVTSREGIALGLSSSAVCVAPGIPGGAQRLAECMGYSTRLDGGVPTDAGAHLPDAGDARPPLPPRDAGPEVGPSLRDGAAADGCPPTLPRCRDT